jgi:hypothetical protein
MVQQSHQFKVPRQREILTLCITKLQTFLLHLLITAHTAMKSEFNFKLRPLKRGLGRL